MIRHRLVSSCLNATFCLSQTSSAMYTVYIYVYICTHEELKIGNLPIHYVASIVFAKRWQLMYILAIVNNVLATRVHNIVQ